jgi:hypothetical protein
MTFPSPTLPPPDNDDASVPSVPPPVPAKRDRRTFVITMIALLFVATESLLYVRWATMTEPTAVLVVQCGEQLRGAEITVDGVTVPLPQPYKFVVGTGGRYSIPFFLEPGQYTVKITQNDQTLIEPKEFEVSQNMLRVLDLGLLKAAPAPATAPAATTPP